MALCIVHVHGRGEKPDARSFEGLWLDALRAGIQRFEEEKLEAYDRIEHEFVFFGDLTNALLEGRTSYDPKVDLEDRRFALEELKAMKRRAFGSRGAYERLPGRSSLGEFLADMGMPVMQRLKLSSGVLQRVVPDIFRYLADSEQTGRAVRTRVAAALERAFTRGGDVAVIAHCLGSLAAFEVLWELSRTDLHRWYRGEKIRLFLTLGSPLGDETVKSALLNAHHTGAVRYPGNILQWVNVTAEDDWVSHDNTVGDDYREMLKLHLTSRIADYRIHNFCVRYGRSNPHSSLGYLIHPRVARSVAALLE